VSSSLVPQIERAGQALQFFWPDYQLTVTLDRFHDAGSRGLFAELQANTSAPGYLPHLTHCRISLTAMGSRTQFAKRMTELYKEADWHMIIEQVCVLGLRIFREGEPVLRLTKDAQVEPLSSRLSPLLYDRLPSGIFGPGGIGKSYVGLLCALLVESGQCLAGLEAVKGSVLYLDYECEYGDFVERAKRLWQGHPELSDAQPLYRRCNLPIADDLPALQHIVAKSEVQLLIIDSLAAACGSDLYAPETPIRLFAALRSLRVSSLILAHVAKDEDKGRSIFGSVFFGNFGRSVWEMKKTQEVGDTVIRVGLYQRKHNLGPLHRPIGLKLSFGDAVHITPLDLTEEPELAEAMSLSQRIKAALRQGSKTPKELADELDAKYPQVKARLSDGQGKWCTNVGDGQWGLLECRY